MVNLEPGRHQHVVEQVEVGTTPQPVGMMVGIHLQLIDATGFDLKINGKILDCLSPTSRDNSQNCESNWVMKQRNILAIDHHYDYCIGPSWPTQTNFLHEGLKMTRYGCKKPCNGKMPCLR